MASQTSLAQRNYDVFLSFRGEDTRKNFTDHPYYALTGAGIQVFRDDKELPRGEHISTQLKQAIQSSRMSIIVLSENYAFSGWCLEELDQIMECKKTLDQMVVPVFYDVDPSNVLRQTGTFAEAFVKHEQRYAEQKEMVAAWRSALTEVANLSGHHLKDAANGLEGKFIEKIVKETLKQLKEEDLFVATHEVGLHWRVEQVNKLLDIGGQDKRMIGICGMSGVGKTTLARKVYNQYVRQDIFEAKSFLDVGEIIQQPNGKVQLQEQFLSDVLSRKMEVKSASQGMKEIERRISRKRVLLVLDNVDKLEHVNLVAKSRDWFGAGSRVIVTTTNERLVEQLMVEEKYIVKEMTFHESLLLFSLHAFGKPKPDEGYDRLSEEVVHYCEGLPLALEVLGCYLRNASIEEWEAELIKLRKIPLGEIQEKLRLNFDALADDDIKNIFLDVCCFFVGMEKDYVVKVLEGCGFVEE